MLRLLKSSVLLASLFLTQSIFCQNLVNNPSFEDFNECPAELGNITQDVPNWFVSSEGTTDYFNLCSVTMGIPKNFNGSQEVEFGKGYAGLYLLAPNDYREYLQGKLTASLVKGRRYAVSFYVSLADKSNYALRDIGILFSEKRINEPTRKTIRIHKSKSKFNTYTFKQVSNKRFFADKEGWMEVYVEIVAKGSEQYITIGNFKDNEHTKLLKSPGSKSAAYYYVDMVSVTPIESTPVGDDLFTNKTYKFENILFNSDKYELSTEARQELDEFYEVIKDDPSLVVSISAHTDTDGTATYNDELSDKRATSVAKYLMQLGLPSKRINWEGHGGEKPVAENSTAEGKRRNRRVEYVISKMKAQYAASNKFVEE